MSDPDISNAEPVSAAQSQASNTVDCNIHTSNSSLRDLAHELISKAAYMCYYKFGHNNPKIPKWWDLYNEVMEGYEREFYDAEPLPSPRTDVAALKFYWLASRLRPEFKALIPSPHSERSLFEDPRIVDQQMEAMCKALARVLPMLIKEP